MLSSYQEKEAAHAILLLIIKTGIQVEIEVLLLVRAITR